VETGRNLEESSKEDCGSKNAVLPVMMMMVMMMIFDDRYYLSSLI
jgi:hypothetical protein